MTDALQHIVGGNGAYHLFNCDARVGVAQRRVEGRALRPMNKNRNTLLRAAQEQLGHKSASMTEHYVRGRLGKKVTPTR